MIQSLKFAVRFFAFWLLYFLFFRLLFFGMNYNEVWQKKISVLPLLVLNSLRLDVATICYVFAVPVLLFVVQIFVKSLKLKHVLQYYTLVVLVLLTALLTANIFLYKSWGTLLNYRAVSFITDPNEIIASVKLTELLGGLLFVFLVVFGFKKLFARFVAAFFSVQISSKIKGIFAAVLLILLTGVGTRGGLQLIPINESAAYFSAETKLNHAAVNPIWYLGHNMLQSNSLNTNPYNFFPQAQAISNVKKLFQTQQQSQNILNTTKPNIVFILLESYTADIIKSLGGDSSTAPNFEKIIADGLLFTNIYSSGFRTDQAFVSVLSGFPAQPNHSIIRYPEKTEHLPSLTLQLKKQGYSTSFFYGGELGFANLNSYLLSTGFEKIIGVDDFEKKQRNSKWGAHDEFVLARQLIDIGNQQQPFFSVVMTLSSHEPFETPIATPFTKNDLPSRFRSAAWYTDYCLGNYFEQAKKQAWYANTLFVIVADHGHLLPVQRDYFDVKNRRIPLVITGGALDEKFRGKQIFATGNQNDIAATVLNQLDVSDIGFNWSNNLLNENRKNFAYVCMDEALGWITDTCHFVFYTEGNRIVGSGNTCIADSLYAKSYLQVLFDEFLAH